MSYKQDKIIVIISEFLNDNREYYPITDISTEKARFFYKDDDGLFKIMSDSDYSIRTETNEIRLYITNEDIKTKSTKFQIGYEVNFGASEYETELPVLSVLVEMYNQLVEDTKTIFNYVKKQCFISDDMETNLTLPPLPAYCVWCMGENGEMYAMPVSDLYNKFDQMVDKVYKEVKSLLIEDLNNEVIKLKKELETLKNEIEDFIIQVSNKEQEKINSLSTKVQGDISSAADTKKSEVIVDIENAGDEEKKELNDHTLKKKTELDEYIDLNKESLIGPRGPRGYSISSVKLLEETEFGNRYEVAIESGTVVGTFIAPKGIGEKGDKGDSIVGPQGDSIGTVVFNKIVEQGYEYDVLLNTGEKIGTFIAPKGPQGESIVGPPGPQGNPGAVVEISGQYVFSVNNDGHLILSYEDGTTPPNFKIDENGHLILTLE